MCQAVGLQESLLLGHPIWYLVHIKYPLPVLIRLKLHDLWVFTILHDPWIARQIEIAQHLVLHKNHYVSLARPLSLHYNLARPLYLYYNHYVSPSICGRLVRLLTPLPHMTDFDLMLDTNTLS